MSESKQAENEYLEQYPAGPYVRSGIQVRHAETGQLLGEACGKNLREEHSLAGLFAAAPETKAQRDELLEAAELVERAWVGDGVEMSVAVDACLLAIARAKGEQS